MKGPSQTLAQNESERDSAEQVGELARPGEALHRNLDVSGVGMMGIETCVTEGDLVCSEKRRQRGPELLSEGESRRERGERGVRAVHSSDDAW